MSQYKLHLDERASNDIFNSFNDGLRTLCLWAYISRFNADIRMVNRYG